MVKKSTTSIRESKSERYKLKNTIKRLFGTKDIGDFQIAINLCRKLTKREFLHIVSKTLEPYDDINEKTLNRKSTFGWKFYLDDTKDDYKNYGYSEEIYGLYIEYQPNVIFADPEAYVKYRLREKVNHDDIVYFFENKVLELHFLKKNPKYEKYFRTTSRGSN